MFDYIVCNIQIYFIMKDYAILFNYFIIGYII